MMVERCERKKQSATTMDAEGLNERIGVCRRERRIGCVPMEDQWQSINDGRIESMVREIDSEDRKARGERGDQKARGERGERSKF